MICCICGKEIKGLGNNPRPVKDSGRCCDFCNENMVIPKRIETLFKEKTKGDNK